MSVVDWAQAQGQGLPFAAPSVVCRAQVVLRMLMQERSAGEKHADLFVCACACVAAEWRADAAEEWRLSPDSRLLDLTWEEVDDPSKSAGGMRGVGRG